MAYKYKYLRLSTSCFIGITHICTVSKGIGINIENKICLPGKEYISVH